MKQNFEANRKEDGNARLEQRPTYDKVNKDPL